MINKSDIKFTDDKKITDKKGTKYALEQLAQPRPNSGIFNLRMMIYFWMGEPKKKGLKRWIKRKVGEAPALYSGQRVVRNKLQIQKYLKDNGYFESEVSVDTTINSKKVDITYQVDTRGQYNMRNIYLPKDSSDIATILSTGKEKSLLKPGRTYNELLMELERIRISTLAKNKGYLNFDKNYLFYFVDTIPGTLSADLYLRVAEQEKEKVHTVYSVGATKVHPTFDLSAEGDSTSRDTIIYKPSFTVIQNEKIIRPSVLDQMIMQDAGDIYNKKLQDISISHLLDLGVFKFVNIKYEPSDSNAHVLNRLIYLTPGIDQSLTTDLELNNRTGSFYGTTLGVTYNHKNVFNRALIWNNRVSAGVETQIGNNDALINTIDLSVEVNLSIPRFIFYFGNKKFSGVFVPRTTLSISNNYQRRVSTYTINSSNFSFGHSWKPSRRFQHIFNPLTLRRVNILSTTAEFDSLLANNRRLASSFSDLFIGGLDYTFTYSSQESNPKQDYWYFRYKGKAAGNVFSLIAGTGSTGAPNEILGQPYSQFLTAEFDLRYYRPLLRKGKIVARIVPAIGYAYGNSDVLPYIEQFFVGGANSLRAFPIRGVGPGLFVRPANPNTNVEQQFFDQTGDIKLELNLEYRFPMFSFLKGALFMDAGNVWLLKPEADTPGGNFRFSKFWNELAVGGGFGFRLDFEYIVVRFDLATPLRRPVRDEGFKWINDPGKLWTDRTLNIAIGYPF